jgi:ribosomal protein S18 acetylase RimI-like enzyme
MIEYQQNLENIAPENLEGFFVGWLNPPSPAKHLEILRGSSHVCLALEGDRVVGFITAISDGVLAAYIPLLEVLPEFQSQGIGRELVRQMLEVLSNFYMIDLLCDDNLKGFYAKSGMLEAGGMMIRNHRRQSGEKL